MLSRMSIRLLSGTGGRLTHTSAAVSKAAAAPADGERDLVNFPRRVRPIDPAPVRMGFVPETWFNMLYDKTGVTGPYTLGVGMITFLMSKEIYVIEHEFYTGLTLGIMAIASIKTFGPKVAAALDSQLAEEKASMSQGRDDSIKSLKENIEYEALAVEQAQAQPILFDAKRENVGLQLEAAYRERLQTVHDEVKKRLDYQLETHNVKTRFEQKHMVDWIVQNVRKSITPSQEAASLKQCITDLKGLAKA